MSARIAVVSDSKYAVVDAVGVYDIDNIASSRYKLHILQVGHRPQIIPLEFVSGEHKKIQLLPR